MQNTLAALKHHTIIVADTGDFASIEQYQPQDATTNPSLIFKAAQQAQYQPLIEKVMHDYATKNVDELLDLILVAFGCEILNIIPGRVSTEVDARLSFNIQASVEKAQHLIALYEQAGIARERVLIKLASTWEGIQAACVLEKQNIHCNLTLLFSFTQAVLCAQAKVQLISPFVGRIYDWHKQKSGPQWQEAAHRGIHDPGVQSVTQIFHYYKTHGYQTEIMGASFRNIDQIIALAGCDLLTISPSLLAELTHHTQPVQAVLNAQQTSPLALQAPLDEANFRFQLNQDAMASEKLSEGIRLFVNDSVQFESFIKQRQQQ